MGLRCRPLSAGTVPAALVAQASVSSQPATPDGKFPWTFDLELR